MEGPVVLVVNKADGDEEVCDNDLFHTSHSDGIDNPVAIVY